MASDTTLTHIGIDLGARSSGNTAVCHWAHGRFRFDHSTKDGDGDAWLEEVVAKLRPQAIYIDAPLSLPGVYSGSGQDYFFRLADHQARGMSPMFLGGLTARAMRLAATWRAQGIAVHEAYPAALIRHEWDSLKVEPRKAIPKHKLRIMAGMVVMPPPEPADRHETDAWLCWVIGHRHQRGEALVYGNETEGLILA
jgi:predicted nuclease with RNAse H fold